MTITDQSKIKEILTRGVEDAIVRQDLEKKLVSGKKLKIYFGIDPTGVNLHLGHMVALWKLRDFQELGHEVILLIGDFTAKIGDPSGRDATRAVLTDRQVKENFKTYKRQASKVLDFSKVKVVCNSKWLSKLSFADILNLSANFTVQQMLARDMFDRRMKADQPISLQEFMYPLMQGYDSVALNVDLEIGGNDQMFNMLVGRQLQKIYNNKDKDVLTCKLLLGTDGRKMSKTFGNYIAVEDSPEDMFGKMMSIKDELIGHYFELATRLSEAQIEEIGKLENPRDIKAALAKEVVRMYYGEKLAEKAEQEFNKVHRDKELPSDMPVFEADKGTYFVLDLLYEAKLAGSKNEAKRLVEGGGVEIIGKGKIPDWKAEVKIDDGMVIRVGSRKFVRIKIK